MNQALCNSCGKLVTATPAERAGKMFLMKDCPTCGQSETLISADAVRYKAKHELDCGFDHGACDVDCLHCRHPKTPNIVFVDTTNRCNMICPICINNTPNDGFLFEPPTEYFQKIVDHLAAMRPIPSLQMFGGEPLVRADCVDIIKMARKRKIPTRVVTNGIKLADEEFCRKVLKGRPTILMSHDGNNPETYRILRGNPAALEKKNQALANISRIGKANVVLMSVVAKGLNDQSLGDLFALCHQHRKVIRGIYFLPLAHTWEEGKLDVEPDRITGEDIENRIEAIFPGEKTTFIPAGFIGSLTTIGKHLRLKPVPFAGAHPNCESFYILFSDGERYVPADHYLRASLHELASDMMREEAALSGAERGLESNWMGRLLGKMGLKGRYMRWNALARIIKLFFRHVRWTRGLRGQGVAKIWHALAILTGILAGRKSRRVVHAHTTVQGTLQIIVLPFEDKSTLETHRLERCPSAFAFYDCKADVVRFVPVCGWSLFKKNVLREIAENGRGGASNEPAENNEAASEPPAVA